MAPVQQSIARLVSLADGRRHPEDRIILQLGKVHSESSIDFSHHSENAVESGVRKGLDDEILSDKVGGRFMRNLRFQVFSFYRRLFGVVFLVNMGVFVTSAVRQADTSQHYGLVALANIFTAILMRQEHVVNIFFAIFTAVPPSWPLWIRRIAARVYTIGGIHSGCGVSGTIWFIAYCAQATREFIKGGPITVPTLVVSYAILILLLVILLFATPSIRARFHNSFEYVHRFMGWTTLACVWAQVILLAYDYRPAGSSLRQVLLSGAPLWLLAVMTGSIILPWLHLRQEHVHAEVLSDHALRVYCSYDQPLPGTYVRLATSPLRDWHSFATIREPGKTGFSMIVSNAGDWTRELIANPPNKIWVRGIPTLSMMTVVKMFRRIVVVGTGSGIGSCMPHILAKNTAIQVLWTAPDVRQTFGDKLVDQILEAAPDAVIYDTRKYGRPDMVKLVHRLVREFNAEAVAIVSNSYLTYKVVYGMMSRGIPAFGAIWDH